MFCSFVESMHSVDSIELVLVHQFMSADDIVY